MTSPDVEFFFSNNFFKLFLELFSKSAEIIDVSLTKSTTSGVTKKIDIIIKLDSKVLDIVSMLFSLFSFFFYLL